MPSSANGTNHTVAQPLHMMEVSIILKLLYLKIITGREMGGEGGGFRQGVSLKFTQGITCLCTPL